MQRVFLPILGFLILLVTAQRSQADDNAKSIIERAIKAHGGADKLDQLQTAAVKAKGTVDIMGLNVAFAGEMIVQSTNRESSKFKNKMDIDVMGMKISMTQVYDGKKAWIIVMDKVIDIDGDHLKSIKDEGYTNRVEALTPLLKDKEFELSTLAEQKINGKPAVGVKVKAKDHKDIDLFFDKETGYLVKSSRQAYDPNAQKDVLYETVYSDFRDFNGVKHAGKALIHHDGKKFMDMEVTEVKLLDKIDPKEFARPL